MSDQKCKDDTSNSLSNRGAIDLPDDASLSDSDPDESTQPLSKKVEELSSSSDEENLQIESDPPQETTTFKLTGGSLGFSFRSKSIFDQLDSAVKITSSQLTEDNVIDGAFTRPAPPSPPMKHQKAEKTSKALAKTVPDYQLHPERWTRYDLDDVAETDDRKNSQVAHEFIQGLRNRKRSQEAAASLFNPDFNQNHSSSSENRIIFTKPSQGSKDEGQDLHKVDRGKTKEVGLVHLDEEQEEDDEEERGKKKESVSYNLGEKKKRKWRDRSNTEEEESQESNVMFSSGRKVNRKNIRKSVEDED